MIKSRLKNCIILLHLQNFRVKVLWAIKISSVWPRFSRTKSSEIIPSSSVPKNVNAWLLPGIKTTFDVKVTLVEFVSVTINGNFTLSRKLNLLTNSWNVWKRHIVFRITWINVQPSPWSVNLLMSYVKYGRILRSI